MCVSFLWDDEASLSVEHLGNGSTGEAPQVSPLPANERPSAIIGRPFAVGILSSEIFYPDTMEGVEGSRVAKGLNP